MYQFACYFYVLFVNFFIIFCIVNKTKFFYETRLHDKVMAFVIKTKRIFSILSNHKKKTIFAIGTLSYFTNYFQLYMRYYLNFLNFKNIFNNIFN